MEFINQLSYLGGPTLWGVSPYRKTSLNSYKWNEITPIASWSIIYIYYNYKPIYKLLRAITAVSDQLVDDIS